MDILEQLRDCDPSDAVDLLEIAGYNHCEILDNNGRRTYVFKQKESDCCGIFLKISTTGLEIWSAPHISRPAPKFR